MANVDTIRGIYDAFGRGDIPSVLGSLDENVEWREAEGNPYQMDGSAWHGPNEVLEKLFVRLGSEWDGFTVHPKEFHETGDGVIVEGRYTGTYKSTGKSIDAQFAHLWKLSGGKVTSFQQYVDTARLQDVTGTR